jgi:large repetitive protein
VNPTTVLSPEIVDLGLAIGLLHKSSSTIEFDSDWFSNPGAKLSGTLADTDRRTALVHFVDKVVGEGGTRDDGGVTLLKLFDAHDVGGSSAPHLIVNLVLDARAESYVEVGVGVEHATESPIVTKTELRVPLYRTGKRSGTTVANVAEHFALAAGAPIRLSSSLSINSAPDPSGFGLGGVTLAVEIPVTGDGPTIAIGLTGLRLPGSTTPVDIEIGGPDSSIEDTLLSLVLGVVRAGASTLGSSGAAAMAALDLIGLGGAPGLPPLDVDALTREGVAALRAWFSNAMSDTAQRHAWLDAVRRVIGGTFDVAGNELTIPIAGSPVEIVLGVAAKPGPGGHLRVTPRVGLSLSTLLGSGASAVSLRAQASIDVLTVDIADGHLDPIPNAELHVSMTGNGARLLDAGLVRIGAVHVGVAYANGRPLPLLRLLDVNVTSGHHDVIDLSSANAVVAAAGEIAGDLAAAAIDALGAAGTHFKALLGLTPPAGVTALDAGRLFADPLGALGDWWRTLTSSHPTEVAGVLQHLRDLIGHDSVLALPVSGLGTIASPWSIPVVDRVAIDVWLDNGTLVIAPTIGFRVDDLAGGCTVVTTSLRAELAAIDFVHGHVSLLRKAEFVASLRGRGLPEARLSLGPVAIVADHIGISARWTAADGLQVGFEAPGLGADVSGLLDPAPANGSTVVPLSIPTGANWRTAVFADVENLVGVLGASNPAGWLHDVVDLLGWTFGVDNSLRRLSLTALVADPALELRRWARASMSDQSVLARLTSTLARTFTGSTDGLVGALSGRGTLTEPWLMPFGSTAAAPSLALAFGPDGPVLSPTQAVGALRTWLPGAPGLSADGLAQAVFDETLAGDDTAALAHGRVALAEGLAALVSRVSETDTLVAPPPTPIDGVEVVRDPAMVWSRWDEIDVETALDADVPVGAAVVRVAIGTTSAHPFGSAPPARLLDLSAPGLTPESFSVPSPDSGDWYVVLAARADAALGTGDPSGVAGQAARLRRVLGPLGNGRPVVLLAMRGAGHAARVAADAEPVVTNLVTFGTPWSAVAFDSARNGASADGLRLLRALLPAEDLGEPDDDDLATGRAIVGGLLNLAIQSELEAPRPVTPVRTGLAVRAWFGDLDIGAIERGFTAIVAAGLSARARARADSAAAPPTTASVSLHLPIPLVTPAGGHGVTVDGSLSFGLATGAIGITTEALRAACSVKVHVVIADSDAWLIGGPGTVPSGGSAPLEVRFMEATVTVGLHGEPSRAEIILHEVSALGAYRDRIVIRPNEAVTGDIESLPFLPEARAALAAVVTRLKAADIGSPAKSLADLLEGIGLSAPSGLIPDALSHLLHDPAAFAHAVMATVPGRRAVADAVVSFVPGATSAGDVVTIATSSNPTLAMSADLAARTVHVTAAGREGVLPWAIDLGGLGGATPTGSVTIGAATANSGAIRVGFAPLSAKLVSTTVAGTTSDIELWPSPDLEGLASFAVAALPAEAVRLVLDGVRGLDSELSTQIDALVSALGALGPPDGDGRRQVLAPLALFREPGAWFRSVLAGTPSQQVERLTDLFEALKPFVNLKGTPRGSWPIVNGVTLAIGAGSTGASMALSIDPTVWLGGVGRVPFAAGVSVGLTITTNGAPVPTVDVFVGLPESAPSGVHRRAVHVSVNAGALAVFLRPTSGSDIALYPHAAGLGALLTAGVDELLPMALNALATLTGSSERDRVGQLVSAVGRGLDIVAEPDNAAVRATFVSNKLKALAGDPSALAAKLAARAAALVADVVNELDGIITQLPGSPHASMVAGNLVVAVRDVTITVTPSPLSVAVAGSVSALPVVGSVEGTFVVGSAGVTAWGFGIGPAVFELGGPKVRPLVRGGRVGNSGWQIDLGLALDDLGPANDGHRELFGRWRESGGLSVVARTRDSGVDQEVTADTDAARVALFAADATLELLGNYVIGLTEVKTLLDKAVGTSTVRKVLAGSILSAPDGLTMAAAPISGLPGSLFVLARQAAVALPALPLGPFSLAIHKSGDVYGVRLDITDANKGLELNPDSDVVLSLVTDATWIDLPSGTPAAPGIIVEMVSISAGANPTVTVHPGISVNGLGLKIAKGSGPLLDAGLRIDAVTIHLFGGLAPGTGGNVAVSGGVQVELDGLAVPLSGGGGTNTVAQGVMHDAGGAGAPPAAKFSPGVAVQSHAGGNGVAVSLRAGKGNGPWYLPIQRAFGPVYLEQVGLGVGYSGNPPTTPRKLESISVSLDGSVSLFGITASVDKLRLTYHVNRPFFDVHSWEVDLDGFGIASNVGGLTLAGALRRAPLSPPLEGVEYLGMLKIGFSGYGVDLFGGYAHPTEPQGSFASFFAFGALHAPLGGPPAFFITGIGVGFGINRELAPPTIESITTNPFMVAMRALGPAPDPMVQLEKMRTEIKPVQGQYWVAAGISFTSFVLVTGEVVVTVQFGDGLDIAVLGLARAELPAPSLTLVSIELALLVRFSTKEGTLLVQAQLTENSWLLIHDIRLTGGFAFQTWWKGPNAGQLVVTLGGYHPRFHHDGYPTVPRLGISWHVSDYISVVGASYFAICSEALMAGTSMEVAAHFGPAHASLSYGGDAIVFFDPFWFEVTIWAEIRAGIRIWLLFGTIDIELSLGASVTVSGPPIFVTGHFDICGFEVPFEFGSKGNEADKALKAGEFRDKYLRATADAQIIQASLVRGGVASGQRSGGAQQKVPDGSPTNPFLVIPEFELMLTSTAPAVNLTLQHGGDADKAVTVAAPGLGVAPMFSHTLSSTLFANLSKLDAPTGISIAAVTIASRPKAPFPKGVWGEAQEKSSPVVPSGDMVFAADGMTISTSLGDLTGGAPINYHQVELPFGGRKPLPFVTNKAATNARVAASAQLRSIADAVRPAALDADRRFNVAARLLEAGGHGALGVAAMRGERATLPTFGSLADDMVRAPATVSPKVTGLIVDRDVPLRAFIAPRVKSLISTPLSQAGTPALHTTVSKPEGTVPMAIPTIDSMRALITPIAPASLVVRSALVQVTDKAVLARGASAVTRVATGQLAAVSNARPDRFGADRLTAMTAALGNGTTLLDGELAVLTIASRSPDGRGDQLRVKGGATRVIALAAGGNVLFDNMTDAAFDPAGAPRTVTHNRRLMPSAVDGVMELPPKTERVVVAGIGSQATVGGAVDGWYVGQSLPLIGWDMALAGGVVVTFANHKAPSNRERRDGGWANTRELVHASTVVTRFDAPVTAVAVAVDDASAVGTRSPADVLDMRLVGATRRVGPNGEVVPPVILVQGVRSILVFDIDPLPQSDAADPHVLVVVEGTREGQLGGVAGIVDTSARLVEALTVDGFDAAVRAPLPGGDGTRVVRLQSSTPTPLRKAPTARKRTRKAPAPTRRTKGT